MGGPVGSTMVHLLLLSLVSSSLLLSRTADAACDFAGAEDLTGVTAGLTHDMVSGDDPLADGEYLTFTCDSSPPVHEYLDEHPANNEFQVQCVSGEFEQPGSWPYCVKKCTVPTPEAGFQESVVHSTGDIIPGDTEVTFECVNSNAYIQGTANDQEVTVTCPDATGIFPSGWGTCEVRCVVPAAEATYDSHPEEGNMVVGGTTLDFNCTHDHGYVTGTDDQAKSVQCHPTTGQIPTGWGACEVKCSVPDPEDGYSAQADATTKHAVASSLTYACSNANAYVDGAPGDAQEHDVDCLATGLFETGWPACVNKCTVPTAEAGYEQHDQADKIAVAATITFNCTLDYAYTGTPPDENGWSLTCGADGTFPSTTWPECRVKCLAPAHQAGYSDPNGNADNYFDMDAVATYECDDDTHLVGNTTSNQFSITCQSDGTFPADSWPTCETKCQIPSAPSGYDDQDPMSPISPGDTLDYTCTEEFATVGEDMLLSQTVTCGGDGVITPDPSEWPACEVRCARPDPKAGYSPLPVSVGSKLVGQVVTFTCETEGETVGDTLSPDLAVMCGLDGTYPDHAEWDDCAVRCAVPDPGDTFSSQPSGTPPMEVGDELVYSCATSGHSHVVGTDLVSTHTVTCQGDGTATPTEWPTCAMMCAIPSPQIGYSPQVDFTPVGVGDTVEFECSDVGAKVGDTYSNRHPVTCRADGTFSITWPECTVRCVPPLGGPGYNSQPAGTPTVLPGETLTYTCMEEGMLSGDTDSNENVLTCGVDGEFPDSWPECEVRCLIPSPPSGYSDPDVGGVGSVAVGETVDYPCAVVGAEAGDSASTFYRVTCDLHGDFPNQADWPECVTPVSCGEAPAPVNGSTLVLADAGQQPGILAYRSLVYACPSADEMLESGGEEFHVGCKADGEYESVEAWPSCRAKEDCTAAVPVPTNASGLAETASAAPAKEGDQLVYLCAETDWYLSQADGGAGGFVLTCGNDGTFGTFEWPTCLDPLAVFEEEVDGDRECHCLGSIADPDAAAEVRQICRDPTLPGNSIVVDSATPPSTKRCGVYDEDDPVADDLCFCDSPLEQAKTTHWFSLQLKLEPWQWRVDAKTGKSPLEKPSTQDYRDLARAFEIALDDAIVADGTLGTSDYVSTRSFRFRKGPQAPLGHFGPPPDPDEVTDCSVILLNALSVPAHLARTDGAADVPYGQSATYGCAGGNNEVMMTEEGAAGRFYDTQVMSLACVNNGNSFSSPDTWPVCVDATAAECAVPTPVGAKGFNADPDSGAPGSPLRQGDTLTYSCADGAHEVGATGSTTYTVTCGASELDSDPYWELKWSQAEADWPACEEPAPDPPANCPHAVLAPPADFARSDGTGEVNHGDSATLACVGTKVMMTAADDSGRFVDGQTESVSCNDGAFADPSNVCIDSSTQTCPIPDTSGATGFNSDPDEGAPGGPLSVGDVLTYSCSDGAHEVGATGLTELEVTCDAYEAVASPWWEAKWDQEVADWDDCALPSKKRKKRSEETDVYNYLVVDLAAQWLDPNAPTADEVQTFLDGLGGVDGNLGTVFIDPDCDPAVCDVIDVPSKCSNSFFENLPDGYAALMPYGYYISPLDPADVDAGLQLTMGEIAELRCTSQDPKQIPRRDEWDHDSDDWKLTVFCVPPKNFGEGMGSWSISAVPDCASICKPANLPQAALESDLILTKVIPYNNPDAPVVWTEMNETDSYLYHGDRLKYECKTEYWGVNGGIDTYHDEFQCTEEGTLDTPRVGEQWPYCEPQTGMVVSAVELMLDNYDRSISDRYKLIDYRESDYEAEVAGLTDYFITVSIPVMCGLLVLICTCCCCSRENSVCCKLCASQANDYQEV